MLNMRIAALTALLLLTIVLLSQPAASAEDATHTAASCSGSDPEPGHTGSWRVAFCNRTGHDIVLEFRDNDCPAENWSRRGDVYRRSMRRDERSVFPLCYANERPVAQPAVGVPMLRIPNGKGVVTSWQVVGDCGEHSEPLSLDAHTFYDRGDYRTGITLLQYPAAAAHCTPGAKESVAPTAAGGAATAATVAPASTAPTMTSETQRQAPQLPTPQPAAPQGAAPQGALPATAMSASAGSKPAVSSSGAAVAPEAAGQPPALRAQVDGHDILSRSVQVFGTNGAAQPGYQCAFTLALGFSDGGHYQDHVKGAAVEPGAQDALIITRKYFKSVVSVDLTAVQCTSH